MLLPFADGFACLRRPHIYLNEDGVVYGICSMLDVSDKACII